MGTVTIVLVIDYCKVELKLTDMIQKINTIKKT